MCFEAWVKVQLYNVWVFKTWPKYQLLRSVYLRFGGRPSSVKHVFETLPKKSSFQQSVDTWLDSIFLGKAFETWQKGQVPQEYMFKTWMKLQHPN